MLNAKLTVSFYLLIMLLLVSKRTVIRFIAENKIVYHTIDTFSFLTIVEEIRLTGFMRHKPLMGRDFFIKI